MQMRFFLKTMLFCSMGLSLAGATEWPMDRGLNRTGANNGDSLPTPIANILSPSTSGNQNQTINYSSAIVKVVQGGDVVFVGGDGGSFNAYSLTGGLIWKFQATGEIHSAALAYDVVPDSFVCFGATDGYFYELNAKNGTLVWKTFLGGPVFSSPVLYGDQVVVCTNNGVVHLLNLADGKEAWQKKVGGYLWAGPLLGTISGSILVSSLDGTITCLDSTGKVIWQFQSDDSFRFTPALYANPTYAPVGSAPISGT